MALQEPTSAVDPKGESDGLLGQASNFGDEEDNSSEYSTDGEYATPPEVILTSLTETGEDESTIPVLMQRSYMGNDAISSVLTDTLCADLGVNGVLKELNAALGTSYNLDSVISILDPYIAQNVDFGTAYAYLRPYWYFIHINQPKLGTLEENDEEMRDVPPRRVWDLLANRVVPYWVADRVPLAISHAWVEEKDRVDVITPINRCEWPVPMLKDASLDLIRIEMLNTVQTLQPHLRAWYVWLDVLCLRQEGGKNEHLRLEEWNLDVPTIGWVYEQALGRVVYYFNGLGQPLHLTPGYFESDRCWFQRAWTLQEMTMAPITAGLTSKGVGDTQIQTRFLEQLISSQRMPRLTSIPDYVSDMRNRVSTKPLDKVAGLVYPLYTDVIPIYDPKQSPEEAWEVLMDVMASSYYQAQLFFLYPEPGDGKKRWRPSWRQVMSNRNVLSPFYWGDAIKRMEEPDTDCYTGYCIKSANVRGLGEVPNEPTPRQGEIDVNNANGALRTIKIFADHMHPIPNGLYTLLGCDGRSFDPDRWVVGKMRQDGRFEKLSVFRSADGELHIRFLRLHSEVKTFLC
ncbi:hypothetical protein EDD18DRAFT_1440977 [Armillaria luteobubalina]|uniref:Heterokaryon incompatibility domain-containing protein n=1 Tax=Armillaria luteobubalina TaxID=153913 RepID=A0AA39UR74_9AGAR|nr:hypothetical protein EDD18DRAFT_1440977 [Armillaria luteobubalina]